MPILQDLQVDLVSFVDRAAVRDPKHKSEPRRFLIAKRDGASDPKGDTMPAATAEELQAKLDKAEQEKVDLAKERDEAKAELEKKNKPADGDEDDKGEQTKAEREKQEKEDADRATAIEKAEGDVKVALEKADEEIKLSRDEARKAQERADESSEIAKGERDIRITREFVAKAEADLPQIATEPLKFGSVLKSASEKLTKEEYDELWSVLKAANEQSRLYGILKEAGSEEGRVAAGSADPMKTVTAKAEEIKKADPSLTDGQAFDRALRDNPDLARGYLAAVR